jgi:hypothetical protein
MKFVNLSNEKIKVQVESNEKIKPWKTVNPNNEIVAKSKAYEDYYLEMGLSPVNVEKEVKAESKETKPIKDFNIFKKKKKK